MLSPWFLEDKYVRYKCMSFMMKLVEKRKAYLNSINSVAIEDSNNNSFDKKPTIFIDQLLQNHEGVAFSEQDIKDHVFTMVSAVSYHLPFHFSSKLIKYYFSGQ